MTQLKTLLVLFLLLLLSAPVVAQEATEELDYQLQERTRLQAIQVKVMAQRTLMDWVREQAVKTANAKHEEEKKTLRQAFDGVVKEMRARGSQRRLELIDELESFVLKYSDTQASGDLLLRLAELYYEEANFRFIIEMDEWDREMQRFDAGEIDVEPRFPNPDYSKPLELYREFVQAYTGHRYYKEALYLYAYILEEVGFEDQAVENYEKLIQIDDRGPLAPEVAFRLGEYYFLTGDLDIAGQNYRHTLRLRDKTFYDKALYKLAWTYYRQGDYERALLGFIEMVDYGARSPEASAMRAESLQYIAIIFSERGGINGLIEFFDRIGGRSFLDEVIAKLGDIYFETADFANALQVYQEVLQRNQEGKASPEISRKIQETQLKLEDEVAVVEEYRAFTERFGPGTRWQEIWQPQEPVLAREVREEAEKKAFDYAAYWHGQGQNTNRAAARQKHYAKAISAYEAFEEQYPQSLKLAEAVFNQAEIYYELRRWAQAGQLYARVPEITVNPANDLFSESAWNMILSYRQALQDFEKTEKGRTLIQEIAAERAELEKVAEQEQQEGGLGRAAAGAITAEAEPDQSQDATTAAAVAQTAAVDTTQSADGTKEVAAQAQAKERAGKSTAPKAPPRQRPLPESAKDLIKASLYFVKLYPLGERSPAVYYNTGDILMRYGAYSHARNQYQSFVERFPDNDFLMDGIKQVTRTFLIEQKFGDLVTWGYGVFESPLAAKSEVREYFTTILSGAMFKEAQQLEASGKLQQAADVYLAMIDRFPDSEYVDEALTNTAIAYQKQGNWERSTELFLRYYRAYPEEDYAPKALFQTAWNAERVLDFDAAVSRYIELLDVYPDSQDTKDALFNSASILAKLGQSKRAAELFLLYISRFPGEEDEASNLFFAAEAYYNDGDFETAEKVFARYLAHENKNEREVEVLHYLATIAQSRNDMPRYWKLLEQIIVTHKRYLEAGTVVDPQYAGEAAFRLAERVDQAYRDIKLRLPMDVMANLLEKKAAELVKVTETYTGVVQYKDPLWSSAALHRIGEAYQHFAESLFDAPVPEELDEDEQYYYQLELEDQAFPIEDKAMQSWQKNLDLAVKLGIDNEWVQESRDRLLKLFPDVARVKASEHWIAADTDFFYRFDRSDAENEDVRIEGPRIVYVNSQYRIENLEERYRVTKNWTPRQKRVVFDVTFAPPVLSNEGQVIEIQGIKELWEKHFQN